MSNPPEVGVSWWKTPQPFMSMRGKAGWERKSSCWTVVTPEPVAERGREWLDEPEHEDRRPSDDIQRDPVGPRDRIVGEVAAGDELMAEPEGDREVGVQVDPVPGFVRQVPPGKPDRADRDRQEQEQRAIEGRDLPR